MWKRKKGSYTVEAAMLMSILIPVFIGIIYLGFYLHDKALLEGAALETVLYAGLHNTDDKNDKGVELRAGELVKDRLLGTRKIKSSVSKGKGSVTVEYSGRFPVPGLVVSYFTGKELRINVKKEYSLKRPGDTIRKVKGLQRLLEKGEN